MENEYIEVVRPDGSIEMVHKDYDQIIADAERELEENPPVPPVIFTEEEMAEHAIYALRQERDRRISETDWWVMADRTPTQAQLDYRQALRDITENFSSMDDEGFAWPEKP